MERADPGRRDAHVASSRPLPPAVPWIAACALVVLSSCSDFGSKLVPNRGVAGTLEIRTGDATEGSEVALLPMTDFPWTAVAVVAPYTSRAEAERVLGFTWPEFDGFEIERSDARHLLVFVSEGKVARVEEVPRCMPDFAEDTVARLLAPKEAVFVVRSGSCPVLHLRRAA